MRHLRSFVIIWTIITSTFFWTTTMRMFMKPEISDWSIFGLSGRGLSGDYWLPIIVVCASLFLFYLEGRGKLRWLFQALLLMWHLGLTLSVLLGSAQSGTDITFGAWGVQLALEWLIIPMICFTILVVVYVIFEINGRIPILVCSWSQVNWKTLGLILLLFPLSYLLFFYGQGFNLLVKLAIIVNIVQWILLSEALGRPQVHTLSSGKSS